MTAQKEYVFEMSDFRSLSCKDLICDFGFRRLKSSPGISCDEFYHVKDLTKCDVRFPKWDFGFMKAQKTKLIWICNPNA